ncbi:MAG: DUF6249 domain-containing protein [Pseudomonadota bacterium]
MNGIHIGMVATVLMFGVIPVTLALYFYRLRLRQIDALLQLANTGTALDAETIRRMVGVASSYKTDYKCGLILVALGVAIVVSVGIATGSDHAAWGLLPVGLGVGFLLVGKMRLSGAPADTGPAAANP